MSATGEWSTRPVGRAGLLVDAGEHQPAALAAAIRRAGSEAVIDVITGATTVLVVGGPAIAAVIAAVGPDEVAAQGEEGEEVEIPVRYDGEDLAAVAAATGLTTAEVVDRHCHATYQAAFAGFAPGFAYLTGLPDELVVARRSEPRARVPAGSVAIADRYSAVYPRPTPGGWHLLGTTDVVLFDPTRSPAALLAAGTRVRFAETTARRRPAPSESHPPPASLASRHVEVIEPGSLTTIQDAGRPGHGGEGVPPSGAADRASAALANRLVGNTERAAVLETTMTGPTLRLCGSAHARATVAVTGAPAVVTVEGAERGLNAAFDLHVGQTLAVGTASAGLRSYIAMAGGFDVPAVLASRSTDVLSGLGPHRLAAGQVLPLGPEPGPPPGVDVAPVPPLPDPAVVRLLPGPRADWITAEAWDLVNTSAWQVAPTSNRVGVRLTRPAGAGGHWHGPELSRARAGELPPEGIVTGAVQLTPAGELVVFGADHPVTGGYPVVAVVDDADLGVVAQLRPGQAVHLRLTGVDGPARVDR